MRDNGVHEFEIDFIGEFHITAVLRGTDFIVFYRAFIRRRRYTFNQRLRVRFKGCPSANLQFVRFSGDRLCVGITEVFVFVLLNTNGVKQLFGIEHIGVHNLYTGLTYSGFASCGVIVTTDSGVSLINIGIDVCGSV